VSSARCLSAEQAEAIGLRALAYVVGDTDLVGRFVTATGSDADDLRRRAGQPVFLGAVLDFLLEDERSVVSFAEGAGIGPELVAQARARLPGTFDER
jgi:hypothetical protein